MADGFRFARVFSQCRDQDLRGPHDSVRKVKKSSRPNVTQSELPVSEGMFCRHDDVRHSDFRTHSLSIEDPFKVIPKRKDHDTH